MSLSHPDYQRAADFDQARRAWVAQRGDGWLSSAQWDALLQYLEALHLWSGRMSLVSQSDRECLATRHLLPSLGWLAVVSALPHATMVDVGSGAGLPGVPLAVALPRARVYLVESRRRRAHFLREVVRRLDLRNATVVHARAEEWEGPTGGVNLVVSRAVAVPADLLRLCAHCMAPHAHALVLCAEDVDTTPSAPAPQTGGYLALALAGPGQRGPDVFHRYSRPIVDNHESREACLDG